MENKLEELTDDSIMEFGMFKGQALANVESTWLQWWYSMSFYKKQTGFKQQLLKYIEDNKESILK